MLQIAWPSDKYTISKVLRAAARVALSRSETICNTCKHVGEQLCYLHRYTLHTNSGHTAIVCLLDQQSRATLQLSQTVLIIACSGTAKRWPAALTALMLKQVQHGLVQH